MKWIDDDFKLMEIQQSQLPKCLEQNCGGRPKKIV